MDKKGNWHVDTSNPRDPQPNPVRGTPIRVTAGVVLGTQCHPFVDASPICPRSISHYELLEVREYATYVEQPMVIIDTKEHV